MRQSSGVVSPMPAEITRQRSISACCAGRLTCHMQASACCDSCDSDKPAEQGAIGSAYFAILREATLVCTWYLAILR
jgi:hypothetical protein